jgi:hypothetical protein
MKRSAFLLAVVLLCGFNAIAQQNSYNSPLFVSPFGEADSQPVSTIQATPSLAFTSSLNDAIPDFESSPASPLAAPEPADPPQVVYGVKPSYDFQAYLGYTFIRFFQVPGTQVNLNGFNYSIVYYPDRFNGKLAADGEFVATFGSQFDEKARFLLGMGGARFRWALPRNLEFWAHALVGGTHYVPQTPYGTESSLAYELGGGVDINSRNSRFSYRISADAIGTRYFNTYQFSPKVSVGFVYKF